jgi:hypothetical protein
MALFYDDTNSNAARHYADSGERDYRKLGQALGAQEAGMQRIASGQDSVSGMQLKQALGQNVSAQRSMAAGAAPRDQAMAGLMASRNAMSLGAGLAGQQAVAGIQERQAAQNALMQALLQRQQMAQNAALQGRQLAAQTQGPSLMQQLGGGAMGLGSMLVGM